VIAHAWEYPNEWVATVKERFDVLLVDPLSNERKDDQRP
jgi:hypothetical protein